MRMIRTNTGVMQKIIALIPYLDTVATEAESRSTKLGSPIESCATTTKMVKSI